MSMKNKLAMKAQLAKKALVSGVPQNSNLVAWERGKCSSMISPSTIQERDSVENPNRTTPYTNQENQDFAQGKDWNTNKTCMELGNTFGRGIGMAPGYFQYLKDLDEGKVKDPWAEMLWANIQKYGTPYPKKIKNPNA